MQWFSPESCCQLFAKVRILKKHGRKDMDELELKSYAKINLGLILVRKRQDGYYDIATVFQQVDLADTLTFARVPGGFSLACEGIAVPAGRDNMVYRAFDLVRKQTGIRGGLRVILRKAIPTGAGLGGGSSNAAATLSAVNTIWGLGLSKEILARMGIDIGSDVPFFLYGGTVLGEGRGEVMTKLFWTGDYRIALVCPDVSVSTAWAYGQVKLDLTKSEKLSNFRAILGNYAPQILKGHFVNEFEGVVFRKHPELKGIKEELVKRGAFYASMSGSGSSIYGLFHDRDEAERTCSFFSGTRGFRAYLTRPILSDKTDLEPFFQRHSGKTSG